MGLTTLQISNKSIFSYIREIRLKRQLMCFATAFLESEQLQSDYVTLENKE